MNNTSMPPTAIIQQMMGGATAVNLLYVAAELGIADLLAQGPKTGDELAALMDADADVLQRVLRGLAAIGVVAQPADGRFGLTPLGDCLRADVTGSVRAFVRMSGHPDVQRAWGGLLHQVKTGETAADHVFGMNGWAYLTGKPELIDLFNEMMSGVTAQAAGAVVAAYDFSGVETVVDVGGGDGTLLRAILQAYPMMRGVILDLPHVRAVAERAIAADGLAERCEFQTGDFFAGVPVGGDVYLLKSVIHDWNDERSAAILATCRRAMAPTSRLLLVEGLMPSEGTPPPDVVMGDLLMMALGSGRERTQAEHAALLGQAGLRLERMIPTESGSSVLEARSVASAN